MVSLVLLENIYIYIYFQEEEAKREADVVLREVLRKKHDAKKTMEKLDALLKLRLARQNTAKGKGQQVLEHDTVTFADNLSKLL